MATYDAPPIPAKARPVVPTRREPAPLLTNVVPPLIVQTLLSLLFVTFVLVDVSAVRFCGDSAPAGAGFVSFLAVLT